MLNDDAGRLVERSYLEFREGTSSKFYALVRVAHADGTQSVSFNFGRIGSPRAWDVRVRRVAPDQAAAAFRRLLGEKLRERYLETEWPAALDTPTDEADALEPPFASAARGSLPAAGPTVVAGITLPAGRPAVPGTFASAGNGPTHWMTDAPTPDASDLWLSLARGFPSTGLWPIIVDPALNADVLGDDEAVSTRGVDEILRASWEENTEVDEDDTEFAEALSPFTRGFPGLAAPTTGAFDATVYDRCAREMAGHLGLVPAVRPADVVAALGWQGWANFGFQAGDMAAVLRSWEERFGAVLFGVGFDILALGVARPPRNLVEATAIAAEHLAFAPDNIFQGVGTVRDYARELVRATTWAFWWD